MITQSEVALEWDCCFVYRKCLQLAPEDEILPQQYTMIHGVVMKTVLTDIQSYSLFYTVHFIMNWALYKFTNFCFWKK